MIPMISHDVVPMWFNSVLASGLSPFLVGGVGKGKSQLAMQYAKEHQLKLHPIYLDSMYEMDVIGYAHPNTDTGKFEYLPCDLFPLESDPMPINPDTGKPYKGHCILFEEFGNCPKSMQVAAQRVILDKSIGSHKLHPKTSIILLGNKVSSGANAIPISAAIRTRCGIAELDTSSQDSVNNFLKYIEQAKFHSSVVAWAAMNQDLIKTEDKDLMLDGESPFLTWRGLGAVSEMMHKMSASAEKRGIPLSNVVRGKMVVFQSLMGYAVGSDFYSSLMNPAMGFEEILQSPTTAQIPTGTAQNLKLASYLASNVTTDDQVTMMLTYLERLDPEMRMSIASKITSASTYLANHKEVKALFEFPF